MPDKWTDREERIYQEMLDRLRFWGYQVPSGEKQMDPALILMLKAFAHHTTATEDKLKQAGQDVIDTLIANFFVTGVRRPVPAFTMLSCRCSDKRATLSDDQEFSCTVGGAQTREYSFYPLYDQELIDVHADIVLFTSGDYLRVLKALAPEADKWEEALDSSNYRSMKRSAPPPIGGTVWIGVQAGLPLEEIPGISLYTGPDHETSRLFNWVKWQVFGAPASATFRPGEFQDRLEIFKHLDIREFEIDGQFQSRLYSSDFLTSGKLHWHFKHYLTAATNYVYIPNEQLIGAEKTPAPPVLVQKFAHIDFKKLATPRIWLRAQLPPDEKVGDLRKFIYFDSNTVLLINRRKEHRNKYTMGQPVLEIDLFEYLAESESIADRLFSIDRVWDSRDHEYTNHLELSSFANPFKYVVVEEDDSLKIKVDFEATGKEPPDYIVVQYSLTDGSDGNGIGAETELSMVREHPQIHSLRNLVSSSGGSDSKSTAEVRRMVGFFLRNHGVALSEGEIEYLARNFDSRVESARAHRGVTPTAGGLVPSLIVDIKMQAGLKISDEEQGYFMQRLGQYLDCYTPLNLHVSARLATEQ